MEEEGGSGTPRGQPASGELELESARTQRLHQPPASAVGADLGIRMPPPVSHDDPTLVPSDTHPTRPEGAGDSWDAMHLPGLPEQIGRFVVARRLGAGGMGLVFEAHDQTLDRRVAVKLLRTDSGGSQSDEGSTRLLREAQALARLSHPNVIQVYEVGTYRGQVFVAMEYIDGDTLDVWQRDPELKWPEILRVYLDAARGLAAAHDAGIVHRDFKPANVMRSRDGRVVVLDFGLARHTDSEHFDEAQTRVVGAENSSARLRERLQERRVASSNSVGEHLATPLTATGAVMGTPAYMSPEQHEGLPTDARTDQFSLCVALWEGLYGERPFEGPTLAVLTSAVLEGRIRKLPEYATQVPSFVQEALIRGLAVEPDARYADLSELIDALGRGPGAGRRRRKRYLMAAGLAAVASLGWWASGIDAPLSLGDERMSFEAGLSESRARGKRLDGRGHGAEASSHWDALVLGHAREALLADPTEAMASLRHLSPGDESWVGSARVIAAEARAAGVAWRARHLGMVSRLVFSSLGDRAIYIDAGGRLRRWEIDSDVLTGIELDSEVRALALAGHGRLAMAWSVDGGLFELALNADTTTRVSDTGQRVPCEAGQISLDQEGQRLVIACEKRLTMWLRGGKGWQEVGTHEVPDRILDIRAVGDELAVLHGSEADAVVSGLSIDKDEIQSRELALGLVGASRLTGGAAWETLAIVTGQGLVGVPAQPAQAPPLLAAATRSGLYDRGAAGVISTDGKRIRVRTGAEPLMLRGHAAPIRYLRAAKVESRLISVDAAGKGRVWRPGISAPRIPLSEAGGIVALDVSDRGDVLVSGAGDGSVRRMRISEGAESVELLGKHPGGVRWVFSSSDGTRVASAGRDSGVRVWGNAGEEAQRFAVGRQASRSVVWSNDGSVVAAGACTIAESCGAELFWPATGRSQWIHGLDRAPIAMSFAPGGVQLAVVEPRESGARVWVASLGGEASHTGPERSNFEALGRDFGRVETLAHDPRGWLTLGVESAPQELELWRVSPQGRTGRLAQLDSVRGIASDHGVLAWQRDRDLHLYDLVTGQSSTLIDVDTPMAYIMMRRGGSGVAVFSEIEDGAMIIDLESRERRRVPVREAPLAWGVDFFDSPGTSLRAFDDRAPQDAAALAAWISGQSMVWVDPAKMHRSVLEEPAYLDEDDAVMLVDP
jgi:WD40 repeat protein/predicted Ser/Thr protein kinase